MRRSNAVYKMPRIIYWRDCRGCEVSPVNTTPTSTEIKLWWFVFSIRKAVSVSADKASILSRKESV